MKFVFEKLLKKLRFITSGRLHPASTDEIKTLKGNSGLARLYIIKYTTKFQDFCKKNELATFHSFDEIRKKLREPQV